MSTLIVVLFLVLSTIITHLIVKRMNRKSDSEKGGCFSYAYMYLLVAAVLSVGITSFIFAVDTLNKFSKGLFLDSYQAKVIGYELDTESKPPHRVMKIPTVEFVTKTNDTIVRELDFSAEELQESYPIKYNEKADEIIIWGFILVLKLVASILFSFIFGGLIIGLFIYATNGNIRKYYNKLISIGLKVFLPLLIVGFEALLIYAYLQITSEPFWVKALLIFFILTLVAVILGFSYAFWLKINKGSSEKLKQ